MINEPTELNRMMKPLSRQPPRILALV